MPASTRRPSRVADGQRHAIANPNPRSMSHTTPTGEGCTDAEANDRRLSLSLSSSSSSSWSAAASPPGAPMNRSTQAFCRRCKSNIGDFYNAWHKVTASYFAPALLASYRHCLQSTGSPKAASKGTDLETCTIQPLSCPSPACAGSPPIAFAVVDAPTAKRNFRGRDFFKLNRIELRCEVSPNNSIVVEPHDDTPSHLLTGFHHSSSPTPDPVSPPTAIAQPEAMDIDSRPPLPQPPAHHHRIHYDHRHEVALSKASLENSQKSLPPLSMPSSQALLPPLHSITHKQSNPPLPSTSPAVKPILDLPRTLPPPSGPIANRPTAATQELAQIQPQSHSPRDLHHINGHPYPRSSRDVGLDAIERLQTQISQNSGALAAHTRDIRRGEVSFQQLESSLRRELQDQAIRQSSDIRSVDDAIARLHLEMQDMRQLIESLGQELHASRMERQSRAGNVSSSQSTTVQDSALELMAQQMAILSQKANEVDSLKITVEIMKNKIQRLEEAAVPSHSQPAPQVYRSPREVAAQAPQSAHTPAYHSTPATPAYATPSQALKSQSFPSHGIPLSTVTPDASQRNDPALAQRNGWAPVNAGLKRSHQNGVDSPHEAAAHTSGSPKRQRLGAVEPHGAFPASMSAESPETTPQAYAPSVPSQPTNTESSHASQSQHSVYVPYGTQDGPSDDSWRPESQRIVEHRPRGRGRGGGQGSRGGRGRKSTPAHIHVQGAPEWEKSEWQGYSDSQASPDGYHNHIVGVGRDIARRGSGGGGSGARGGYIPGERAMSLGLQGVTAGANVGSPGDPYAHTKKTRTKPVRNADGVLIRKDGRPDMRSQSSAANLRKVHARKEGDPNLSPSGFTPTNLKHATSVDTPSTPSPSNHPSDQGVTDSVHKKHTAIMDKMFPSGVDESRKQHDYARQVFEDDRDYTAHSRSHSSRPASKSAVPIKKEQGEQQSRSTNMDSPQNEGVDVENLARDESQTPGERSDHSRRESEEAQADTLLAKTVEGNPATVGPESTQN